jgi:hypothetical protein
LAGFVVLLAIGDGPVDAGIRPSFRLDGGLWSAAHIVSVQTTPADGVLSAVGIPQRVGRNEGFSPMD